jgi:hypothetical protein
MAQNVHRLSLMSLFIGNAIAQKPAPTEVRPSSQTRNDKELHDIIVYERWTDRLLASRALLQSLNQSEEQRTQAQRHHWEKFEEDFPVAWDWLLQDGGSDFPEWFSSQNPVAIEQKLILRALSDLASAASELRREFDAIRKGELGPNDARGLELYAKACEQRRAQRLRTVLAQSPKIIFTRHRTLRPSFFAYTEGQSDAQNERHFLPGSSLCLCDADGKFLRRLGFDQVHAIHPAVMDDGRVIYTRWDYNDRGQIFPQGLFQMNPDGTGQTEFYGNNSWFPTTIAHARGIPGTQKTVAIFTGHHTAQTGKLGILDPSKGRQENSGAQLIAPLRPTPAERIDAYGQNGELFQYPYPLSETEFLVTYAPLGWQSEGSQGRRSALARFSLYWMDLDGRRELLTSDPNLPCTQPVPLVARTPPPQRSSLVDYRKTTGTYYEQDVYAGPGLQGVPRGTIKRLRAVALEYRDAARQRFTGSGPARPQPSAATGVGMNALPVSGIETAFSLRGDDNVDRRARRKWSDAYLVLTQSRPEEREPEPGRFRGDYRGRLVNWIGSQSVPTLLPPHFAGAASSELMRLLERGHKNAGRAGEAGLLD